MSFAGKKKNCSKKMNACYVACRCTFFHLIAATTKFMQHICVCVSLAGKKDQKKKGGGEKREMTGGEQS